jgi:LacI family transcriptional regulator
MPVVMFDVLPMRCIDKVIIDDKAAAIAVQSLIDKGRRKLHSLPQLDYVSVGKLRTDGYAPRQPLITISIMKTNH